MQGLPCTLRASEASVEQLCDGSLYSTRCTLEMIAAVVPFRTSVPFHQPFQRCRSPQKHFQRAADPRGGGPPVLVCTGPNLHTPACVPGDLSQDCRRSFSTNYDNMTKYHSKCTAAPLLDMLMSPEMVTAVKEHISDTLAHF